MARKSSRFDCAAEAVRAAIDKENARRKGDIKPIEIVKHAIAAYLAFSFTEEDAVGLEEGRVESIDLRELRRGTQASVDRMLFNANYWRAAYEASIVAACDDPSCVQECLQAVCVWTAHPLRLNKLSPDDTIAHFERFFPPFALNNRRGSLRKDGSGKGPLPDLERVIDQWRARLDRASLHRLEAVLETMENEARAYDDLEDGGALNALFLLLPVWCLQNKIELVRGTWWDDSAVMTVIIAALSERFLELGLGNSVCQYFVDSCHEALDAYHRELSSEPTPLAKQSASDLIDAVRRAREDEPAFETDGYGSSFPAWLIGKEQLIWNILVCSLYGPACSRPLLVDSPDLMLDQDYVGKTDVLTELAQTSFVRYTADRMKDRDQAEFETFASLPTTLRDSSVAYIASIPSKLSILGYEVLPLGTCYPERRVLKLTPSEVECLAILEHRRWLNEREQAGWTYGELKDVEALKSPHMVPWEELSDRAREWNRSAIRSIPTLLASVNLAVVK